MCDGGVATWNRSSGPRPSASHQCAVAWAIERCVCRTAFGSPVVPELNTSTASSVSRTSPAGCGVRPPARAASSAGWSSRSVTRSRAEALAEDGRGLTVGDGMHRSGQLDGMSHLDGLPRRAEEDGRRAELADGVDHDDELHAVRHHHRHAVARPDAPGCEVLRERVAEAIEIPEGPAVVAGPNGVAIPEPISGMLEPVVHQGRSHRKHSSRL